MKNLFSVFFVFLFSVQLFFPTKTFAQTAQSGNVINLGKDQTINGDYFAGGENVVISGTVNGDVYVGGGTVQIDGTVNGDILAAGGTLLVRGSAHNVRVAGGNVTIDGTVDGNVTAVGGNVLFADGAKLGGSAVAAGGQISVLGPVAKGATLAGGQVTIANSVGGDVLGAGNVTLTPNAKVNGNFTYWSEKKATVENGAQVSGKITQNKPPQQKQNPRASFAAFTGASLMFALINIVSAFVLGVIFIELLPQFTKNTVTTIREHPWVSLGIGILAAIAMLILLFILFLTILGIPLALILLVTYVIYVYISQIFVSLFIGIWVLEKTHVEKAHLIWALLLGLVIYQIIGIIPFIGWLVGFILWFMALGALLITYKNTFVVLRDKKLL